MIEVERVNPDLQELAQLFSGIQTAAKAISNLVKRSQLPTSSTLGYQGEINVQGEDQKKLDVITNNVLKLALRHTGKVQVLASEEEDTPVGVNSLNTMNKDTASTEKEVIYDEGSKYVTVFDPLDGSSNVDAAIPTGTIFGIFPHDEFCDISGFLDSDEDFNEDEMNCMVNTLQPGNNLVAAGYILYSSSTILTMTIGCGVCSFTLDEQLGEFILSHPNVQIPESAPIMSFNEANYDMWDEPMQQVHNKWRKGTSTLNKRYTSRYVGSMVADVHRTLMYGGVFGYPADLKNKNGKLRLLYEAAPMSFLMEQAGGLSSTGKVRIMDIVPENVHQRVPVILGSKTEVQEVIDAYEAFKE
jgi:fructose-1,6-bisphosphatase I